MLLLSFVIVQEDELHRDYSYTGSVCPHTVCISQAQTDELHRGYSCMGLRVYPRIVDMRRTLEEVKTAKS